MPVADVTGDVGVVVPIDDVVEALDPDGLTAVAAVVAAPGVGTPDPVAPSDVVMLVRSVDVVIEGLADPGEGLLPDVDVFDVIDDGDDKGDGVGAARVNSIEIPLLPSTDPV